MPYSLMGSSMLSKKLFFFKRFRNRKEKKGLLF